MTFDCSFGPGRRLAARIRGVLLAAGVFAAHVLMAGSVLPDPVTATVAPEFRSAYQARGLVIEDRPVAIVPVFLMAKTPDFGSFGVWTRWLSSLSDRKETMKSQFNYERDWALRWRYDWKLTDDLTLRTDFDKVWMTFWGYRAPYRGTRDHTLNEWRLRQELRNPVVTPYYYLRRSIEPADTLYVQTGAFRTFALTESLSLKPQAYVELGNARLMHLRYGARTDGRDWRDGIQTVNGRLDLAWRVSEPLTLTAGIHEFITVNEPARHCVKAKTSAWSRRDLTIWSLGARFVF